MPQTTPPQPLDSQPLDSQPLDVEQAVRQRYSAAAGEREAALCCPVEYNKQYLEILPQELIDRDYGCGDPSKYVAAGETVLDLGSGGGKICYIAAQVVGRQGHVIGVDRNDEMLALARKFQQPIAETLGYHNVTFRKGSIQDLGLDLEAFEAYLQEHPVESAADWLRAEAYADVLRKTQPLVADASIDVIVSNCVLNLVRIEDRRQMFAEMLRVLKPGGRAVISDIVSDRPVPPPLRNNPELWSGCISGAFVEEEFAAAFEEAGFHGLEIVARQQEPWTTVEGIEFRSLTLRAYKPLEVREPNIRRTVVYKGPWKSVTDDAGQTLVRGERTTIDGRQFTHYCQTPYRSQLELVDARPSEITLPMADGECCSGSSCC